MARVNVLLSLEGGEELRRALRKKAREVAREMGKALPREGELLQRAADSDVPRGSGELAASSSVTASRARGGTVVRVAVAYLDEKAAAVHEGIHYGRRVQGTRGFKWLERAMQRFAGGFVERVGARLRRLAGGG